MKRTAAALLCAIMLLCTMAPQAGATIVWSSGKQDSEVVDFIIINNTAYAGTMSQGDGNWYTNHSWASGFPAYSTLVIPNLNVSSSTTSHGSLYLTLASAGVSIYLNSDTYKDAHYTCWSMNTQMNKSAITCGCLEYLPLGKIKFSLMMRNSWDDNRTSYFSGNAKVILLISDTTAMDFSQYPTEASQPEHTGPWICETEMN